MLDKARARGLVQQLCHRAGLLVRAGSALRVVQLQEKVQGQTSRRFKTFISLVATCFYFFSFSSCTFEDDCQDSDWLSTPDEFQQRMVSHEVTEKNTDQVQLLPFYQFFFIIINYPSVLFFFYKSCHFFSQITLMMQMHANVRQNPVSNFTCEFSAKLCSEEGVSPNSLQCYCSFPKSTLPTNGE